MSTLLKPRHRIVTLGALTGASGAALALALATWQGGGLGTTLGLGLATSLGAAATFAASRVLERTVREHLAAVGGDARPHPPHDPGSLGDALEAELAQVRRALAAARQAEGEMADLGRTARTFWAATHGAGDAAAPPSTVECVAAFFDTFRQTAEVLVRYAATLEEANERMASGAVDQTETVARTTSTVEDLSDRIDRISRNAEDASGACERTRQEARLGLERVHHVIEGMDRLRAQIESNGRKARRLGDRSVEIGTIVELIRGISSRTDMLALNATIESVRAGEHGRGFAVVAEEIRKLAERTAAATRDIGTLVEAIQADTHASLRALVEEQSAMEQEAQRVREAGAALERISQVAENSAQLVDGISRSTNDQVVAAQDLVRAMQRISDVSHLTLERATRSRESIQGLSRWSERLQPLTAPDPRAAERSAADEPAPTGSSFALRRSRRPVGTESVA